MSLVHQSCLNFIHLIVNVFVVLWDIFTGLLDALQPFLGVHFNGKTSRIPKHLAFVSYDCDATVEDFSKIVTFAYNAGVKRVSIYDPLQCYCGQQIRLGCGERKSWTSDQSAPIRLHLVETKETGRDEVKLIEEKSEPFRDIEVLLYDSKSGGRQSLVSISQEICTGVTNGTLTADRVDVSLLRKLHTSRGLAEPDCLLIFAPSYTSAGFSPWTLRLTELYLAGSIADCDERKFLKAMRICGNRQQRFGR